MNPTPWNRGRFAPPSLPGSQPFPAPYRNRGSWGGGGENANLVTVVWRGCEKLHYLNPVPLFEVGERWIRTFERSRLRALDQLKRKLEDP